MRHRREQNTCDNNQHQVKTIKGEENRKVKPHEEQQKTHRQSKTESNEKINTVLDTETRRFVLNVIQGNGSIESERMGRLERQTELKLRKTEKKKSMIFQ